MSLEAKNDHNYPSVGDDSDSAADTDEKDDEGEQTDEEVVPRELLERKIGQLSPHSTRSGRSVKPANYNMKYHPMDMVLRPKASEKQAARIDRSSVSSMTKKSRQGERVSNLYDDSSLLSPWACRNLQDSQRKPPPRTRILLSSANQSTNSRCLM